MYVTKEIILLMEQAEKTLRKHDEDVLAQALEEMLTLIRFKKQARSNYFNIINKKRRGTYKGDE